MQQLDLLKRPSGRTAMLMASGFTFDLEHPCADGMPIADVARSLAYQPRWAGATREFYSVAEHSVMVSRLVPPAFALDGLCHDLDEAISGDIASCVKLLIGREHLKKKLDPIKRALARRFGFRLDGADVKHADLVCMATELRDLLPPAWMDFGHLPPPHPDRIVPVGPERAFTLFLERYEELKHLAAPAGDGQRKRRTPG
ncbi:hydrolase [Azospirillum thiophilum]|uniref:Hydrolase n=1 Tax=Azospirillum thiophilum TaxID=528244 RepID=A0AAC9EY31_9PROT|nr:hydrolase [Azospirillum thiophilum]ALG73406.1 hydrolase [Azospirillum thiophilum]KJR62801.1 hydrolase [Azospirillum thiophilum]